MLFILLMDKNQREKNKADPSQTYIIVMSHMSEGYAVDV